MKRIQIFSIMFIFSACSEFLETGAPETLIIRDNVLADNTTAISAMISIYAKMNGVTEPFSGGPRSISFFQGLASDELVPWVGSSGVSSDMQYFYLNDIAPESSQISTTWGRLYHIIYCANDLINGLRTSEKVTSDLRGQLEGEARFVRAFCYFYLVNLFGDIPFTLSTDYKQNSTIPKTPVSAVYESIIEDLLESQRLLPDTYPSEGRVRPNKSVAQTLLARAYLYSGHWAEAELHATNIIENSVQYELVSCDKVFLKDSREAIWQLFPVPTANNGFDAQTFVVTGVPNYAILSDNLLQSFESNDRRRTDWVGSTASNYYFPYKYKVQPTATRSEYSVIFRLAELYLVRAEARAQQDNLHQAIEDIDIIRQRANLPLIAATNPNIGKEALLLAIEHERKVELFSEWGHRWFDLKRTGRSTAVLSVLKSDWDVTDILLPIPESEILRNKNLAPQNPGY